MEWVSDFLTYEKLYFLIKNGGASFFIFIEITLIFIYSLETGCDLNVHMTLNLPPVCWDIAKEFATNVKYQKKC